MQIILFFFFFFTRVRRINICPLHSVKPPALTFTDGPRWFSRAWAAQQLRNVYLKSLTHTHAHSHYWHIHRQIHIGGVPLYYLQVNFPFQCHYKRPMRWGRRGGRGHWWEALCRQEIEVIQRCCGEKLKKNLSAAPHSIGADVGGKEGGKKRNDVKVRSEIRQRGGGKAQKWTEHYPFDVGTKTCSLVLCCLK